MFFLIKRSRNVAGLLGLPSSLIGNTGTVDDNVSPAKMDPISERLAVSMQDAPTVDIKTASATNFILDNVAPPSGVSREPHFDHHDVMLRALKGIENSISLNTKISTLNTLLTTTQSDLNTLQTTRMTFETLLAINQRPEMEEKLTEKISSLDLQILETKQKKLEVETEIRSYYTSMSFHPTPPSTLPPPALQPALISMISPSWFGRTRSKFQARFSKLGH